MHISAGVDSAVPESTMYKPNLGSISVACKSHTEQVYISNISLKIDQIPTCIQRTETL